MSMYKISTKVLTLFALFALFGFCFIFNGAFVAAQEQENSVPPNESASEAPVGAAAVLDSDTNVLKSESGKSFFRVDEKEGQKSVSFHVLLRDGKFIELKDIRSQIQKEMDGARRALLNLCKEKSSLEDLNYRKKDSTSGSALQKIDSTLKVIPKVKVIEPQETETKETETLQAFNLSQGVVVKLVEHYVINESFNGAEIIIRDSHMESYIDVSFINEDGLPTYNVTLKSKLYISCD